MLDVLGEILQNSVYEIIPRGTKTIWKSSLNSHVYWDTLDNGNMVKKNWDCIMNSISLSECEANFQFSQLFAGQKSVYRICTIKNLYPIDV